MESFGARTALQIAQFNAQLTGPNDSYWADVFDNVVNAWGRGVGDFANQLGQMPQAGETQGERY